MVPKLAEPSESLAVLLNCESIPRVSHLVYLGWGLRICISNKFPSDEAFAAAALGAML